MVDKAKTSFADIIDIERIGAIGDSHGGFIVGRIITNESKELLKAAVMMNPVLNLCTTFGASDLP